MKHLEDLRDAGIGCIIMVVGVIILVKTIQFIIELFL